MRAMSGTARSLVRAPTRGIASAIRGAEGPTEFQRLLNDANRAHDPAERLRRDRPDSDMRGLGERPVDVDGIESGYLSFLVSFDQGRDASAIHHLSFTLLQVVVALHIVAVLFYLWKKQRNLIAPMWHGDKHLPPGTPAEMDPLYPQRWKYIMGLAPAPMDPMSATAPPVAGATSGTPPPMPPNGPTAVEPIKNPLDGAEVSPGGPPAP